MLYILELVINKYAWAWSILGWCLQMQLQGFHIW